MIHRDDLVLGREPRRLPCAPDAAQKVVVINLLEQIDPRTCHDRAAKDHRGITDIAATDARYRPPDAPPRARWRSPRRSRRIRRSPPWRRPCARTRPTSSPPMPRTWPKRRPRARQRAFLDRLALDGARIEAMADGLDVVRALPDPVGVVIDELEAAERHDDRARARAARRHRRDLRKPAQRHGRRRRAVPQSRQRGDPARRFGEFSFGARDPCRAGRRACAKPDCPRMRSRSCRRATAPRSG